MILSLVVFVVILVLAIPSAAIFIPLAAITGDVRPLYAVVCFIVRVGYFVGGIRFRVLGGKTFLRAVRASSWRTTCRTSIHRR